MQQPTSFYRVFENTLNFIKNKITGSNSETNLNINPSSSKLDPDIEKLKTILERKKEINHKLKGTKLCYMIERCENEDVYLYI
jgi:hypothetical protein